MLGWLRERFIKLGRGFSEGDPVQMLSQEDQEAEPLVGNLEVNLRRLQDLMGESHDLVLREFRVGAKHETRAAIVYIDDLVDKTVVQRFIMQPLMLEARQARPKSLTLGKALERLKGNTLSIGQVTEAVTIGDVAAAILNGDTVLFLADEAQALVAETRAWEGRQPEEPVSEATVRGSREGFTETLRTNVAMLRRRLKTSRLRLENYTIGRISRTDVTIAYLKGITPSKIVEEVRQRLQRIDTDGILESGYIEEFIEDNSSSLFSLVSRTERPDKVAAGLLEGRVAIFTANTPFVLMVPRLFVEGLQATEDYYERYLLTIGVRTFRYVSLFISMLLPSLYVAITTFHQEMLPSELVISIAGQREGVPFPAVVEALLMEITFEILREAGIRLPRQVGQAISIVGALVIGDAAVRAGIVSPVMVIVVAMTAIASFTTPAYDLAITMRMVRLPLVVLAGLLGLFGVMAGLLALLIHACSLKSFGVPFTAPLAPTMVEDYKDVFGRAPWWALVTRPGLLVRDNRRRQGRGNRPGPPDLRAAQEGTGNEGEEKG